MTQTLCTPTGCSITSEPESRQATYAPNESWKKPCPNCDNDLQLRESSHILHESEWHCDCGWLELSDLSLFDHTEMLRCTRLGQDPEFPAEIVRADLNLRLQRRAICKQCHLHQDDGSCGSCGCRIKHRTYYTDMCCPENLW